jgi:hypothetical protein
MLAINSRPDFGLRNGRQMYLPLVARAGQRRAGFASFFWPLAETELPALEPGPGGLGASHVYLVVSVAWWVEFKGLYRRTES